MSVTNSGFGTEPVRVWFSLQSDNVASSIYFIARCWQFLSVSGKGRKIN